MPKASGVSIALPACQLSGQPGWVPAAVPAHAGCAAPSQSLIDANVSGASFASCGSAIMSA